MPTILSLPRKRTLAVIERVSMSRHSNSIAVHANKSEAVAAMISRDATRAARAVIFYDENPSPYVLKRTGVGIMDRMLHDGYYEITSQEADGTPRLGGQSTNIVAAFMQFHHHIPCVVDDTLAVRSFVEFGAMTSRQNGFNHQATAHAIRLLSHLEHGDEGIPFAATYRENDTSSENLLKRCGYVEAEVCPEFRVLRRFQLESHNQRGDNFRTFRATIGTVLAAAKRIVDIVENPVRRRRINGVETNEEVEVRLGNGFQESFYLFARMIVANRPADQAELCNLVFSRENALPEGYLV